MSRRMSNMSVFTRPSIVFAIVFGCFAVLIPRIFWPIARNTFGLNPPTRDDETNFRRPPVREGISEGDQVEYIHGSPPHMRGPHPGMRVHADKSDSSSKSLITFALPMYAIGISIYLIYTVCKVVSKRNVNKEKDYLNEKYKNIRWDPDSKQFQNNDDEDATGLYTGLDPEYIEYLKQKKKKKNEAEQFMTTEQKQMHQTLADMKSSLTFISSKLMTKQSKGALDDNEITQLQSRLEATESQMCQVLNALQAASEKVGQFTNNSAALNQNPPLIVKPTSAKTNLNATRNKASIKKKSYNRHVEETKTDESDTSESTDDDRDFNNENSLYHASNNLNINNKQSHYDTSESLSSDDENEEEQPHRLTDQDDDPTDLMELGCMETNYDQHPSIVNDYELKKNTSNKKIPYENVSNNRGSRNPTVHLWNNRNNNSNSQSLSASTSDSSSDDNEKHQQSYHEETFLKNRRKH
ncbi:unnamed protein product [Didymodactylos carnosus]|uniref:Resistance to inhibitors of cholinesterase protein 3 N-terminal domain-containing protein n=1 Tax=Didymodactylos carnosus TaxID=1234261 RepID=A0A813UV79_9BILA|nr:unnamed protein product [Didymodactylos carnosus]CAF0828512.1 unnamed protein product [Didymodactylos carnosus]CAF3502939.1 unnamed protein product [Didymodactylos carnosus]CAF3615467.1 unnamed protein product [Didymodactylos carnosus]